MASLGNQSNYTIGRLLRPQGVPGEVALLQQGCLPDQARMTFTSATAASPSWPRASCPSCAPSRPLWPAWPQMTRTKFTFYDVVGGTLWVVGIVTIGYLFGNIPRSRPIRQDHLGHDPDSGPGDHCRRFAVQVPALPDQAPIKRSACGAEAGRAFGAKRGDAGGWQRALTSRSW